MKLIKQIPEDEMIAEFLRAEINSTRFGKDIIDALKRKKKSKDIVTNPDLSNNSENQLREELLREVREEFFENFPDDIKWYKAIIQKQELKKVKYIDYSYWNELSDKTRSPIQAANNINTGVKIFGVSNKHYFEIL